MQVVAEDMPKMKALLGKELFEFALDGGDTIKFPEDEVWGNETQEDIKVLWLE